jgi:ketosteroid isomerase-like protein
VRAPAAVALVGIVVWAVAGAAPPAVAASQPVKSDQEVIIELEKSWNAAFYRKDVKFIESILTDEFISTYEDGTRADKKKELALTAAFDQQVESAVQDDFTVKVFGDTAVVWFTLHLVGIKQGQRAELMLSYTDVWILRDGHWRCVSAHSTRVNAK